MHQYHPDLIKYSLISSFNHPCVKGIFSHPIFHKSHLFLFKQLLFVTDLQYGCCSCKGMIFSQKNNRPLIGRLFIYRLFNNGNFYCTNSPIISFFLSWYENINFLPFYRTADIPSNSMTIAFNINNTA